MNKVYIIGNLARDPESKTLPNGTNLCTFTVAVNQIKGDAQYFRVTAWRQLAENCQRFLAKGRKVAVIGSVSLNTYKKGNGEAGASMEVNADEVEFLSPKEQQGDADDSGLTYTPPKVDGKSGMVVIDDEETLPF
jgi:single-strand DNA-binding protein